MEVLQNCKKLGKETVHLCPFHQCNATNHAATALMEVSELLKWMKKYPYGQGALFPETYQHISAPLHAWIKRHQQRNEGREVIMVPEEVYFAVVLTQGYRADRNQTKK
uniref:Uncharacterized protein n=1 Tax=Eutreptiella gymnastica TaxID=73025 RepID=A0A7S1J846_9EUGL|mmetsp:Transcript_74315/g.131272  ORF Transcript_74315/g.131272 Transcript_74315/m.131272 type:complete len:108 (+) Transcript_74315:106-429(+)